MHWIGKKAGRFGLYSWLDGAADEIGSSEQDGVEHLGPSEQASVKENPAAPEAGAQSAEA